MKNPELYHKTIGILVKAYQKGVLQHSNCFACAVGNLVANPMGKQFVPDRRNRLVWLQGSPAWQEVFCVIGGTGEQHIRPLNYTKEAKWQIDSTGYQWQDLAKIEYAFETAPKGNSDDDWMLNGLMAVVDVLNEIHEVEKDASKELFVKEVTHEN